MSTAPHYYKSGNYRAYSVRGINREARESAGKVVYAKGVRDACKSFAERFGGMQVISVYVYRSDMSALLIEPDVGIVTVDGKMYGRVMPIEKRDDIYRGHAPSCECICGGLA